MITYNSTFDLSVIGAKPLVIGKIGARLEWLFLGQIFTVQLFMGKLLD